MPTLLGALGLSRVPRSTLVIGGHTSSMPSVGYVGLVLGAAALPLGPLWFFL